MEKLKRLEDYVRESNENEPTAAEEAVQEYFSLMETDQKVSPKSLMERMEKDKQYKKQFKEAISLISVFVFVMVQKAAFSAPSAPKVIANFEIEPYFREFLMLSRGDDKDIVIMKKFYFDNMDAKSINLGEIDRKDFDSEEDFKEAQKEGALVASVYDKMLHTIKNQYIESKSHL